MLGMKCPGVKSRPQPHLLVERSGYRAVNKSWDRRLGLDVFGLSVIYELCRQV